MSTVAMQPSELHSFDKNKTRLSFVSTILLAPMTCLIDAQAMSK